MKLPIRILVLLIMSYFLAEAGYCAAMGCRVDALIAFALAASYFWISTT